MLKNIFKSKADKTLSRLRANEEYFLDSFSSCVSFQAMWSAKVELFKSKGLPDNAMGVAELVTFWEERLMRELTDYADFRQAVKASKDETVQDYFSQGLSIMGEVNKAIDGLGNIAERDIKDVLTALRGCTYRTVTTMDEMIAEAKGEWPLKTHDGAAFPPSKPLKFKK